MSFQERFKNKITKTSKEGIIPPSFAPEPPKPSPSPSPSLPLKLTEHSDHDSHPKPDSKKPILHQPFVLDQPVVQSKNQTSIRETSHPERSRNVIRRSSQPKKRDTSLTGPVKLGGLGPNIGGEEWQKQKEKRDKMKEFSDQLKIFNPHLITTDSLGTASKKKTAKEEELQKAKANRARMTQFAKKVPKPKARWPSQKDQPTKKQEQNETKQNKEIAQFERRHRELQERLKDL